MPINNSCTQDPVDFMSGLLISRVCADSSGDLLVRDGSIIKGPFELWAEWLNVNKIIKDAKVIYENDIITRIRTQETIIGKPNEDLMKPYIHRHFYFQK